jgi:zinc/manganese transport system substrate-binding protein
MILILDSLLRTHQIVVPPRSLGLVLTALLLMAACSADDATTEDTGVTVIATTTVLGDVVAGVVGDGGSVEVIVPVGVDPHDFQASSRQAADLAGADLVVANGLSLEEGLSAVLDAAQRDGANLLELAPLLDPIPLSGDGDDPHVWMDPLRMADASHLIAAELAAFDGSDEWAARAEKYAEELIVTDAQIRQTLAAVPAERRILVTNHDSLGYFAERYDFDVVGVVIPGGSTLADPSSAELAELVRTIEREGVTAIFAETTQPSALADAVAAEVGFEVTVVELHTGSLGEPGSDADTLAKMLLANARKIADQTVLE